MTVKPTSATLFSEALERGLVRTGEPSGDDAAPCSSPTPSSFSISDVARPESGEFFNKKEVPKSDFLAGRIPFKSRGFLCSSAAVRGEAGGGVRLRINRRFRFLRIPASLTEFGDGSAEARDADVGDGWAVPAVSARALAWFEGDPVPSSAPDIVSYGFTVAAIPGASASGRGRVQRRTWLGIRGPMTVRPLRRWPSIHRRRISYLQPQRTLKFIKKEIYF